MFRELNLDRLRLYGVVFHSLSKDNNFALTTYSRLEELDIVVVLI